MGYQDYFNLGRVIKELEHDRTLPFTNRTIANRIQKAVEANSIKDIEREIQKAEESHRFYLAGVLAEKLGDTKSAKNFYYKSLQDIEQNRYLLEGIEEGSYIALEAARFARKVGEIEKANNYYEKRLQMWEREKRFDLAAKVAEEMGDIERARDLYEKAIHYFEGEDSPACAIEVAKQRQDIKKVNELSERYHKEKIGHCFLSESY